MAGQTKTGPDGFAGVYNILSTPFTADLDVDETSLRRLVSFTLDMGVDGITILGVAGEAHKLTSDERRAVTVATLDTVNGAVPVIVGVSHDRTDDVITAAQDAQRAGAMGVMVAPPKGSVAGDALTAHYSEVAASITVPIVLQDYPAATGVALLPEDIAQLVHDVPSISTIKLESEPTPQQTAKAVTLLGDGTTVLGGMGGLYFLQELRRGSSGTMTGFSYPEILIRMWVDWNSGDARKAAETFYRYLPLIHFEGQPRIGLAIRKESLRRRGFIENSGLRPPGEALDDLTAAELGELVSMLSLSALFDTPSV